MDQTPQLAGARVTPGFESWLTDTKRTLDLDDVYLPHPKQQAFHESPAPHRLLGGAAGPGKTACLVMDHTAGCLTFSDPVEARQVQTLLLRRTHPQLEGSLIPRFRELVPRELYRSYNETKKVINWLNGAQTRFGSMQHEHDVWNYQGGQFWKIGFDELTQFTLYQWFTIGAWNRCPVDPNCTKDGATNPVGISASDFACLFGADGKGKRPSPAMDDNQRRNYHAEDYEYFPCTYLDNPIYANDPLFLKQLENYTGPVRDALKYGKWGALGTYFDIWDEAIHTYERASWTLQPWFPVWISGDWGFAHNAATHWHAMNELGQMRTIWEYVTSREEPELLAASIVKQHRMAEQVLGPMNLEPFMFYSHDAFHEKTSANTIALQMTAVLQRELGVQIVNAGTDKKGGETLMYSLLQNRVKTGVVRDQATGAEIPMLEPKWMISKDCPRLIAVMPQAPREDRPGKDPETIADFLGDDPIDSSRYGVYGKFSGKVKLPIEAEVAKRVTSTDPTIRHLQTIKAEADIRKQRAGDKVSSRRWRPQVR